VTQNLNDTGQVVGVITRRENLKEECGPGEKSTRTFSGLRPPGSLNYLGTSGQTQKTYTPTLDSVQELESEIKQRKELQSKLFVLEKKIADSCERIAIESHVKVMKELDKQSLRSIQVNRELEKNSGRRLGALEILSELCGMDQLLKSMSLMLDQTYNNNDADK